MWKVSCLGKIRHGNLSGRLPRGCLLGGRRVHTCEDRPHVQRSRGREFVCRLLSPFWGAGDLKFEFAIKRRVGPTVCWEPAITRNGPHFYSYFTPTSPRDLLRSDHGHCPRAERGVATAGATHQLAKGPTSQAVT